MADISDGKFISAKEMQSFVNEMSKMYTKSMDEAFHVSISKLANLESQMEDERERRQKRNLETILEMQQKGLLKNGEEAAKYYAKLEQENRIADQKAKLEALKELSAVEEKKRKKEEERLKKQVETQKKLNSDDPKQKREGRKEQREEIFLEGLKSAFSNLTEAFEDPNKHVGEVLTKNVTETMKHVGKALEEGLNKINDSISKYAQYQTAINTRLQGASNFSTITNNLKDVAFSPLVKAEDLYANLNSLVGEGIVTNVEQRAFFMTIKDAIATTFDVNADYLKRMVKVQQEDSTAARLGMESYLTRWLNEYVQNTEYLTATFDQVASSLFEASALLKQSVGSGASEEFEFVVQKWLVL